MGVLLWRHILRHRGRRRENRAGDLAAIDVTRRPRRLVSGGDRVRSRTAGTNPVLESRTVRLFRVGTTRLAR